MSGPDETSSAAPEHEASARRDERGPSSQELGGEENMFAATGRRKGESLGRDGLGLAPYADLDNVNFRVSDRSGGDSASARRKKASDSPAWSPLVAGTWLLAAFTLVSVVSLSVYVFRLSNRVLELERAFASSLRGSTRGSADKASDMNDQFDVGEPPNAKHERKRRDQKAENVVVEDAKSVGTVDAEPSSGGAEPAVVTLETDDGVPPREPNASVPKEKKRVAKKGAKVPKPGEGGAHGEESPGEAKGETPK